MDDQKQRPEPDQIFRKARLVEPDVAADTEGHRYSGFAIPDAPEPEQSVGTKHLIEPDEADDTEGHRFHGI